MRRHAAPHTVRAERSLTRAGLWVAGAIPSQLQLPLEASGLSSRVRASGPLAVTPDYDVFAWLCERWIRSPTATGWMRPTLYEVGSAMYAHAPSRADYRTLRAALDRLAWVRVSIDAYDADLGDYRPGWVTTTHLLELSRPARLPDPAGLVRPSVRLAEWLREALADERVTRLCWRTMRAFGARRQLAKRLWVYLAAERWRRVGRGREATWIAIGDRLCAALGMHYAEHRQARAALARACEAIRQTDPRYAHGELGVARVHGWQLRATRPTWEAWRDGAAERERVQAAIAASLADPSRAS